MTENKKLDLEIRSGIVTVALSLVALLLFLLSFSTKYYIFGQLQSGLVLTLILAGIALAAANVILRKKLPDALWAKLLTFGVTALLAAAAILLLGDRVEGIGTCILTDYDSGHGGEEAIYMSLGAVILLLLAVVFNIIGSFESGKSGKKGGKIATYAIAGVLCLAVLITSLSLGGIFGSRSAGSVEGGAATAISGTYTVSFNANNENLDKCPSYQFLCSDFSGFLNYDSRFYADTTLTLDGNGGYTLFAEAYCVEGGKRCEIGDDTGLGMNLNTTAEGTYTTNSDGSVTISPATHAVFTMEMDTYSSQMKEAAGMHVGEHTEDGVYDSKDYPEVLDFVPETLFTLSGDKIVTWCSANVGGTYTVSFNINNENLDKCPSYQFLCSDFSGLLNYDSRFYADTTLTLDGAGGYTLFSEAYCIEGGKRCELGDDTGLGMNLNTTAEGTYTLGSDGSVTISPATHAVFTMEMDTYSSQMKEAAGMRVGEHTEDGVYDSNEYPEVLSFVPETVFTLSGSEIVTWRDANAGGTFTVSFNINNENLDKCPNYQFLCSDFSGLLSYDSRFYADVTLTLDGAGSYTLFSEAYCIEGGKRCELGDDTGLGMNLNTTAEGSYVDNGDGTVTIGPATHAVFTMEMDTYSSQMKEAAGMRVGDHTEDGVYDSNEYPEVLGFVPESLVTLNTADKTIVTWTNPASEAEAPAEEKTELAVVPSDDEGTSMTFFTDGTYRFWFEPYSIEDLGTWTFADGVLTLTDINGLIYSGEGNPIHLHYGYSGSPDQLTGEYTIDPAIFTAAKADEKTLLAAILSDDTGTEMSFFADGTYRFWFEAYSIEDLGTWTFADGVLTLTDVNGLTYSGEGDPIHLHYGYSVAPDQLTGEYTIDPAIFAGGQAISATVISNDTGTSMYFFPDGTYRFWFEPYSIEDLGTWTFENGVLTLTDAKGAQSTAEGDPLRLHYAYSESDQLTGDYTIPASTFLFEKNATVVPSDDAGTTMCFFADGTYRFEFGSYSIVDEGTWTFENGVLTLIDVNGAQSTAEGETLHLHYAYSVSDQLTGDYTINPAIFG